MTEFAVLLDRLRVWAGDPSFRILAKTVGPLLHPPRPIRHTTLAHVFQPGRRRLDLDLVVAIVRALGLDEAEAAHWRENCARVHAEQKAGGPVGVFRQLPTVSATFTGREKELKQLLRQVDRADREGATTVVVSAVEGMAGVGKTQLAVHAAHTLRRQGRFTGLQLYVNLRGFDPESAPADPGAVLDAFLRQLRVPAEQIPDALDERAAMFRDRAHGKNMLIVLDNAANEEQVRDLIPGSPGSLVLITSRRSMAGLAGAAAHFLDLFSSDEATELLARIAGVERVRAESDAAAEIAELCGHLPLAVSLAAARLRARPAWSLAHLAELLRSARLDAMTAGGRAVRPVLELSYQALDEPLRRVFRLASLHVGDDFTAPGIAALADIEPAEAESLLERLQDVHLLQQKAFGRYELHDLLRIFARERLEQDETAAGQAEALRRLILWHLHSADAAARVMTPQRRHAVDEPVVPGRLRLAFETFDTAQQWLDAEHTNLVAALNAAADTGSHDIAARFPRALWELFSYRCLWTDWIQSSHTALESARALGDADSEAWLLSNLGSAFIRMERYEDAIEHLEGAVALFAAEGSVSGQASASLNLAMAYTGLDRLELAEPMVREAIALHRSVGNKFGESGASGMLGLVVARRGRHEEAVRVYESAIALQREIGDRFNVAVALLNSGESLLRLGRLEQARTRVEEAVRANQALGGRIGEASCWETLGEILSAQADPAGATEAYHNALELLDGYELPQLTRIRGRLESLLCDE